MIAAISHLACALVRPLGRARHASRLLLVAGLAVAGFVPGTASADRPADVGTTPVAQGQDAVATSTLRPEVRLRKLHLVRPDLIMYPLAYDIYC